MESKAVMGGRIQITAGDIVVMADIEDTPTAALLLESLPIQASANIWGDEIYFGIGVNVELEDDAQETVELGTVAYWPPGDALCFFFGPTPMSVGDEIRPASAVNVFGKIEGDCTVLKRVPSGALIHVELA
jgi:hypothetical protein